MTMGNEWQSLSKYQNIHQTQSEKEKLRIAKFTERLVEIFDVKLIETPTKMTPSSDTEAEVGMQVDEPSNVEVGQAEEEPGCSSECVPHAKKRSSAIEAGKKWKRSKSSDEDDDEFAVTSHTSSDKAYRAQLEREKSNKQRFINGTLVTKLDAMGLTDRQSVRVISEVAQALGHSLHNLVISRSTIQNARKKNREENATRIE